MKTISFESIQTEKKLMNIPQKLIIQTTNTTTKIKSTKFQSIKKNQTKNHKKSFSIKIS